MLLRGIRNRALLTALPVLAAALWIPHSANAQVSLPTVVNLALQNNPKVRIAQADLARARAVLAESHDVFIPAVTSTAGVGKATGAPLGPPIVFGISAQSLVYSFSQRDFIHAAQQGVTSARLALQVARSDVAEDATSTYVTLDNALQRQAVERQALDIANRLVTIVGDRYNAGVDPHIDLTQARRTAAQIRLQELEIEDEINSQCTHLAALTGLPASGWKTVPASIPALHPPTPADTTDAPPSSDPNRFQGISAAFATARARQYTAAGDKRYVLRPQISFSAQFSHLSDAFSSYDFYYPGFHNQITCTPVCSENGKLNSFNSLSFGVQISLPLLDMVHHARAEEAAADAARALADAEQQQNTFLEGRQKLRRSAVELAARADLAALDHDLAQDQLDALMVRLRAAAGATPGTQANPKDEENARLAERQRTLDFLNTELQLKSAEITLLRQEGQLTNWLAATIPGATAAPASAIPPFTPVLPPTVGSVPGAANPPGAAPAPLPTSGTIPPSLPSAPVSNPSPTPPGAPEPSAPTPQAPSSSPHP